MLIQQILVASKKADELLTEFSSTKSISISDLTSLKNMLASAKIEAQKEANLLTRKIQRYDR